MNRRFADVKLGVVATPLEVVRFIFRNSKRIAISVIGALFLVAGLGMLVLPGPGVLVIAIGFAILGTEYAWAAAALERTKRTATHAGQVARGGANAAGRTANGAVRSIGRRLRRGR